MKKILPLLILILLAAGCKTASKAVQKDSDYISFEYVALTRGAYNKVIVKQDTVITIKDRAMENVVTTGLKNGEWNKLMAALDTTDAENIGNLTPPSTKHQFDGALAANLKIIRRDQTWQSSTFDHGNPPAEIKDIVDTIIEVSALEKK